MCTMRNSLLHVSFAFFIEYSVYLSTRRFTYTSKTYINLKTVPVLHIQHACPSKQAERRRSVPCTCTCIPAHCYRKTSTRIFSQHRRGSCLWAAYWKATLIKCRVMNSAVPHNANSLRAVVNACLHVILRSKETTYMYMYAYNLLITINPERNGYCLSGIRARVHPRFPVLIHY